MLFKMILCLFGFLTLVATSEPTMTLTPVMVGDTTVNLELLTYARTSGWTGVDCPEELNFINLHENEFTSFEAGV